MRLTPSDRFAASLRDVRYECLVFQQGAFDGDWWEYVPQKLTGGGRWLEARPVAREGLLHPAL